MPQPNLPSARIIDTPTALDDLIHQLQNVSLVAFDTESNSLHAYRERVCLIQVSTRDEDYILDPLAVDVQPLEVIFADATIEKVFHAAEYDLMCLKRDYGFVFRNLFDTMMAARICGQPAFGLSALLQEHAGVKLDKTHQRDDWGKRPLPVASLQYAQMDTHYLPMLRDIFLNMLIQQGHMDEAKEAFEELCHIPAAVKRVFDSESFWHIGRPNLLNKDELLILRELVELREHIAEQRDIPPYKILTNNMLVAIARQAPMNMGELKQIRGITARQTRRYGEKLLKAVRRGQLAENLSRPPRPDTPDPVTAERYTVLHTWRKERALERGVDSDVIISKQALWDIAAKAPNTLEALQKIKSIGPWKFNAYGAEILQVLEDYHAVGKKLAEE
jgi:ribonuclease D